MKAVLEKIPPVHPDKVPPLGSELAGVTPWGEQLYRLRRDRSRAKPMKDEDGKRVMIEEPNPWEKMTGVPQPHGPRTTVWFGSRFFKKAKSYSEAWEEE